MAKQVTISPVDNTPYVTRTLATTEEINTAIERSNVAFQSWKKVPVKERVQIMSKFVDAFVSKKENLAMELTLQMGRFVKVKLNHMFISFQNLYLFVVIVGQ